MPAGANIWPFWMPTIGDQTGIVMRIRIRATTIMDWDRKEILIPDKAFITDRLIN
jgi:potassium efflux system protein